ncbi:MAG: hypothetical protein Q8N06_10590 [Hydrogenophaga sp.]|nr:hypothetical protein [Hydrogenophaga sp.]
MTANRLGTPIQNVKKDFWVLTCCSTDASNDDVELMGMDHPPVQEELGRWRSAPPEELDIAVDGDVEAPVLLLFWMVEASA